MFARFIVPINRHPIRRSLFEFINRDNCRSLPQQRNKHQSIRTGEVVKSNSKAHNEQQKLKIVQGPFRDSPTTSSLLPLNDSDTFGTISQYVTEPDEIDEGDAAEDEYYRTIPLRRDQLPQIQYQHMIQKHIRNKQLKEAIDILEVRMKGDRVKPSYYIYELLIIECGRSGYTKKAFKLYNRMKKRGLEVHGPVYAALFNACAKTIHPVEGLNLATNLRKILFQNGHQMNEIIYNAMIKAFGRCGDINTAFQLVDEMKAKNLPLKIDTMNHLLQVCCSDKEYGFRHALYVWHKIFRRKLMPDVYSFNLMIRCTRDCSIGDVDEMAKTIAAILESSKRTLKMQSNRMTNEIQLIEEKPSVSINANAECNLNSLDGIETNAMPGVDQSPQKKVCDQLPNLLSKLPHLGSIVRLSMVNTPEDRFALLGGLSAFIDEMEEAKVRPNVKTFSQLVDVIAPTRDAEHELIQNMRNMRVRADTDFFNLLMKRRILRKDYEGAMQVLDMMHKVHLDPDIVSYGIMAMTCINREQAQQFWQKLNESGIRINIEILGALLKNATYVKDNEFVIDVLKYAIDEKVRPSSKFYEILCAYKNWRSKLLKQESSEQNQLKWNEFYAVYKKWTNQMGLQGVPKEEAIKLLEVHPWKQLKEAEGDGIEILKNERTRRYWKRQHTLKTLNPTWLNHLPNENVKTIETTDKLVEIDNK